MSPEPELRERPEVVLLHTVSDVHNDNVDAIVRLPNGEARTVTFFTLANIATLMQAYAATGECAGGRYFWARDMLIVSDLTIETIQATVLQLVRSGEYAIALGQADPDRD